MEIKDRYVRNLGKIVALSVKFMALLIVLVILWAVIDVVVVMYKLAISEPFLNIGSEHLLTIFSSFLTVLIAIEIFVNIIIYLTRDMFNPPLVMATALTAVARKVIVLEYNNHDPMAIFAIASIVISVGISYWLVSSIYDASSKNKVS